MNKIGAVLAVTVLTGVLVCTDMALAGRVGKTQIRRQHRIRQGVETGELTRREVGVLEREQRRIQAEKQRALSDGVLTPGERGRLKRMQEREDKHIYRLKHNEADR
jgi:hypothetical protein